MAAQTATVANPITSEARCFPMVDSTRIDFSNGTYEGWIHYQRTAEQPNIVIVIQYYVDLVHPEDELDFMDLYETMKKIVANHTNATVYVLEGANACN